MNMMGWDMMDGGSGGGGMIGWVIGFFALWMMLFGSAPLPSFRNAPQ